MLIVDDDEGIRTVLEELLAEEGHAVSSATNGQIALDMLRAGLRPCLILLDLMMPLMNGWEVAERLRRDPDLASIPVVILSAHPDWAHLERLGAACAIGKPFDFGQLMSTVDQHCMVA